MQPARSRQEDFLLVEINNAKFTRPAMSSGEERGLLSRTAAGNRAYLCPNEGLKNSGLGPVSRKCRKLFGLEEPFVKLRPAYSVRLVFSYVVKEIKIKISAK